MCVFVCLCACVGVGGGSDRSKRVHCKQGGILILLVRDSIVKNTLFANLYQ